MATVAKGYLQISDFAAARSLGYGRPGNALPGGTLWVLVQAEGQAFRWRDDGVAPTGAVGMVLAAGDAMIFDQTNLAAVQFMQQAAGGKLNITYYGG